ncbi:phage tail protein [Altericroceibacterium endophyticum]|uniref:Phage tail protein n=1 Tax=Altericroceibacterium endophyticum TaxID=1808508 RepID=A0A6I4T7L7_9SPHN|nr:phage tail protein [Altericroceibacterium endophyticum]
MKKPNSLRAHLTAALPELARDPDALDIYVTGGSLAMRCGGNLGFEQRYTMHVVLLDYRGEPEQLFLPLSLWLRHHQGDLLLDPQGAQENIRFQVDLRDNQAVDVALNFPVTEAVDVLPDDSGGYRLSVREEAPFPDQPPLSDPLSLLRQIWAPGGEQATFLTGHPGE